MNVQTWLENAVADAERRGLPELKPLLETLARTTEILRQADEELQRVGTSASAERRERE